MPIFYLTAAAVLFIHEQITRDLGGGKGLLDEGALLSALARPRASFARRPLYPSLVEKAAALLESLCKNHPFVDGNKRVAYTAAGLFLSHNGWGLKAPTDDAVAFMMGVAAGKLRKEEIRIWLEEHIVPAR